MKRKSRSSSSESEIRSLARSVRQISFHARPKNCHCRVRGSTAKLSARSGGRGGASELDAFEKSLPRMRGSPPDPGPSSDVYE